MVNVSADNSSLFPKIEAYDTNNKLPLPRSMTLPAPRSAKQASAGNLPTYKQHQKNKKRMRDDTLPPSYDEFESATKKVKQTRNPPSYEEAQKVSRK